MSRPNRKPGAPRREPIAVVPERRRFVSWLDAPLAGGIFVVTAAAFLPTLNNDFVNWDDFDTLVTNTRYRGLGLAQLHWMFTTFFLGHYQPLTWVTWSLDYLLWGKDPFGFHLTNLVIHSANAVLFYFFGRRILQLAFSQTDDQRLNLSLAAAAAALFFAVHPLRVESVAWITERRDVLSAHMLLWTLIAYLRASRFQEQSSARRAWLRASLFLYILSLLAKATGMTLALVLLILDIYPLRRLSGDPRHWLGAGARKVLIEKVPFLLLGLIFAGIALIAQEQAGALSRFESYPILRRVAQALYGICFYVWKTLLPFGLSPFYQLYPKPNVFSPFDLPFVASAVIVVALTITFLMLRKRWPALLAAWACYIVVVSPVLGLAQSGPQFVADRYSYLSCAGWALLAGAGVFLVLARWPSPAQAHEKNVLTIVLGGFLLLALAVSTWHQTYVWRDSESLWRRAVAVNPRSTRALVYLGAILKTQGNLQESADLYQQALRMDPDYTDAHYNFAQALAGLNRLDAAIDHLRQYIDKQPGSALAHVDLGNLLGRQGKTAEEIAEYQTALTIDSRSAAAHFALGNALAKRGELENAKEHLSRAVELNPQTGDFYLSLGNLLIKQGRVPEAMEKFREAIRTSPGLLPARNNLGRLVAAQGDLPAAIEIFRETLRIDPNFAPAHESLALALDQIGKRDEAVEHYREAMRLMQLGPGVSAQP